MTIVIQNYHATDQSDVDATLAANTHTCGYVHAWVDLVDPLLVWYLTTCPADSLITSLRTAIDGFVAAHITDQSGVADPYDQAQAIINLSTDDAYSWIDTNAYDHLATFLKSITVTREEILASLSAQGYTN
jgi:hypothetical protein